MSVTLASASTVDISGSVNRPPIVLLHAASYTRKMWLPIAERLQADFRLLAPDLPGHGTCARAKFSFAQAVEDVLGLLNPERIERALLVGVSLGGCLAIDIAAQHPGRVSGLILSGCTFDPRGLLCRLVLTGEGYVFPRGARRFTRSLERYLQTHYPGPVADEVLASGTYWAAAADAVLAMRGVDFRAKLASYPGPTLILNGAHDWVHRTAERAFARSAQNASVRTLPGAGHIAALDAPDAFADAIREFVRSRLPSPQD